MSKAQITIQILNEKADAIRNQILAEYDGTMAGFDKHPLYPALQAISETMVRVAMENEMLQSIKMI